MDADGRAASPESNYRFVRCGDGWVFVLLSPIVRFGPQFRLSNEEASEIARLIRPWGRAQWYWGGAFVVASFILPWLGLPLQAAFLIFALWAAALTIQHIWLYYRMKVYPRADERITQADELAAFARTRSTRTCQLGIAGSSVFVGLGIVLVFAGLGTGNMEYLLAGVAGIVFSGWGLLRFRRMLIVQRRLAE